MARATLEKVGRPTASETRAGGGSSLPALSTVAAVRTLSALLIAAAVLVTCTLAYAQGVPGEPTGPVDLNAPVISNSTCVPCHARIAEGRRPGLVFSHAAHMLVSCDGCHWQPPHDAGNTLGPQMESCFNCHGVPHGSKGEVARGDCRACHTSSFDLRPRTHVKTWAGKPHADRAKAGANSCLMCHDPVKQCDACHIKEDLGLPATQSRYKPLLPAEPRRPPVMVYPDRPVTIGQCINCHPDLDQFTPGRVIFAHADHLERRYDCKACHVSFAHGPDITKQPDMPTCYQCHQLVHASKGEVATGKCSKCHPKKFDLKPSDHTKRFEAKDHRVRADRDPAYCAMCHAAKFCTTCHQGRPAKRGGRARPKVIPANHRKSKFLKQHGGDYLSQRGACGSCHESKFCEKCHKTAMPHPADWTASHGTVRGLDTNDCNVCHTDRASCQECHHNPLKGTELIRRNCVRCHDEMSAKDPTTIKNKGLAEHAVHFDVAKSKGEPYRCEKCHVGFGSTSHLQRPTDLTGGHDLRVCYECHGALDYRNVLIAPYPGNQLCMRCHKSLNI